MADQDEQQQDIEDEFDAAWDEELSVDDTGADDDTGAGEDEPGEGAGEEEGAGEGAGEDEQDAGAGEGGGDESGEEQETPEEREERLRKEEQRLRSWEGRIKKREEELKSGRGTDAGDQGGKGGGPDDGDEGAGDPDTGSDASEASPESDTGAENDQGHDELAEEYGEDLAKAIDKRARKIAEEQTALTRQELEKRLSPVEEARQEEVAKQHENRIKEYHSDLDDIAASDDFYGWIESLPSYARDSARQVVESGTADEVIELLDSYKGTQQGSDAGNSSKGKSSKKADHARAVPSRQSRPPQGQADDFDSAWEQF